MPFWIDTSAKLKLAIAPRPRGGDWLEGEIGQLKREGLDTLVSLLTLEESRELGLEREAAACAAAGIKFHDFAVPDRGLPESVSDFLSFARSVCIGRSSVLLATLMRMEGFSAEEAFDRISQARGLRVPDTAEQSEWVARLPI